MPTFDEVEQWTGRTMDNKGDYEIAEAFLVNPRRIMKLSADQLREIDPKLDAAADAESASILHVMEHLEKFTTPRFSAAIAVFEIVTMLSRIPMGIVTIESLEKLLVVIAGNLMDEKGYNPTIPCRDYHGTDPQMN